MGSPENIKTLIKRTFIVLGIAFAIIIISFVFHVIQINKFNQQERYYTSDTVSMDVTADIHPRGMLTDSWEKNDAFEDMIINGKIYEAVITNNSKCLLSDWQLRVNIKESCWINNAWNGTVEIHQFVDGQEKSQTIDLRDYNIGDISLDYQLAGQDLLIPLNSGDYIIYWPYTGNDSGEVPLKSTNEYSGQAYIGLILYSISGDNDLSDYVMTYHLNQSYFSGTFGTLFLIIIPAWILIMLVFAVIAWIVIGFESTMYYQSQIIDDMFSICSKLADEKDYYHKDHSNRVAKYAKKIAEAMGMDKQDCNVVYYGALLHNIGNYAVPERILGKSSKLTEEDEKIIQVHTMKGAKLVEDVKSMPQASSATLYHHERFDGTGYPTGKKGEEIPLIARIISVADAYDDISRDREYRKKYTLDEMKTFFKEKSGTWYDPFIIDVFLKIIDSIEE
ncbi:HD-GYP domain-containing protein [Pseudobutyrivibrio ruminis]|uniref:HD domain-containing protein n=1 Tax=Pseudobutyrivibrio ruminis DSM 9787 TaxID=1123011 RepID=A0A285S3N7_9FIRM|nr:HD domain-containing phosphohydrolase [Pseudobutyrivibrio ruminis]SOC01391.1 HD domain-containing protein [Pseudobutyrivibrio ruminis DSM 9787]